MDEIKIDTIQWSAPEYSHKERNNDWFWALGIITVIACGIAIWFKNNIFAIFILLSGCSLIMFTLRQPKDASYTIETKGLTMGKDLHTWKSIKSFNIKNNEDAPYVKLLIETSNYFLPIYTIPLPKELENSTKESLLKIISRSEIDESKAMVFVEKLGF
jgi:uncharacterized protein YceK